MTTKTQTKLEAAQAKQLNELRAKQVKMEEEAAVFASASAEAITKAQEEAKVFRVQATGTGKAPGGKAKRPINVLGFEVPYNQDARVIVQTAERFAMDWEGTTDQMKFNLQMIALGVLIDHISSIGFKAHLFAEANGLYEGGKKKDSQDQAARGMDRMKELMGK